MSWQKHRCDSRLSSPQCAPYCDRETPEQLIDHAKTFEYFSADSTLYLVQFDASLWSVSIMITWSALSGIMGSVDCCSLAALIGSSSYSTHSSALAEIHCLHDLETCSFRCD